jgi:hypothetical protein
MLEIKLLFFTMTNILKIFHFMIIMLKNPILKIDLSRFFLNASTCMKCHILQNGLQVDEILIFIKKINLMKI